MKTLTPKQVALIKQAFEKEPQKKLLAAQGHISTLMGLSILIGESLNYSMVSNNLTQVI
jgi:hypothetical protein